LGRIVESGILRFILSSAASMSFFSLSRWRPIHLVLSWCVYWSALVIGTLGPAIPAILSATRPNVHGEVNASFGNSLFVLTIKEMGNVTWTGSVHAFTAALWIGVPPLLLWLLWLRARSGVVQTAERETLRT
jgi:hypothetical protein